MTTVDVFVQSRAEAGLGCQGGESLSVSVLAPCKGLTSSTDSRSLAAPTKSSDASAELQIRHADNSAILGRLLGTPFGGVSQAGLAVIPNSPHQEPIAGFTLSRNGRALVTYDRSGQIKLWDLESRRIARTIVRKFSQIDEVELSANGFVVAIKEANGIEIWNAAEGVLLSHIKDASDYISAIAVSPDGRVVASSSRKQTKWLVETWDAISGVRLRAAEPSNAPIHSLAFSANGKRIYTSDQDKKILVLERDSLKAVRSLNFTDQILSFIVSPNEERLLTYDGQLWDIASTPTRLGIFNGSKEIARCCEFVAGGKIAGIAYRSGHAAIQLLLEDEASEPRLEFFDPRSGKAIDALWKMSQVTEANPTVDPFNWRGALIATGSSLFRFDRSTGKVLNVYKGANFTPKLSSNGRYFIAKSERKNVDVFEIVDGANLRRRGKISIAEDEVPLGISPDGRFAVIASDFRTTNSKLSIFEFQSGNFVKKRSLARDDDAFVSVEFPSDNESSIALGTAKGEVVIMNTRDGATKSIKDEQEIINALAFQSRSHFILTSAGMQGGTEFKIRDVETGILRQTRSIREGGITTLVSSKDGKIVLIGDNAGILWLWKDEGDLTPIFRSASAIHAVSVSDDGSVAWVGRSDGVSVCLDLVNRQELASLFIASSGDWVILTPEGFFDASPGGAKLLSVVRGLEAYSIDQFYDQLHRPDLVREKLAGDPKGLVRKAAAQLDLGKALASGNAPRVMITLPASGGKVQGGQIAVEAKVTDQGGGIGKVEWRVNGVTLGVEPAGRGFQRKTASEQCPSKETGSSFWNFFSRSDPSSDCASAGPSTSSGLEPPLKITRSLTLTPGDNHVTVVAYNAAGYVASIPAEIAITSVQDKSPVRPRMYVLAVGVNDYWDSALHLANAAPDAKAIADGLKRAGSKLYDSVEVTTVLDKDATAANLDRVFTELGGKVRPQDVFVFFLAGHGKTEDARYYFLPYDFRYAGEASIRQLGIDQDRLQGWLLRIKAQKSVALFDTCESGSLVGDRIETRGLEEKTAIDRLVHATGRATLTATSDNRPAIEGYRGHGVFTYTLLAALGEADTSGDGRIDVNELVQYVDDKLPELSYAAFGVRQVPQNVRTNSSFPIVAKTALMAAGGAPYNGSSGVPIPASPTHVVIAPAQVREAANAKSATIVELKPGTQVRLIETANGWTLVARDGKKLGYVQAKSLITLQ
ncbi:caspase family protein [Rhodopseudomonas palustris]|uniref:caspase family protein n=1 Tax=Rhodopseudomonas palustris TaxID=1076 RepID=UPI0021F3ABA6|nr:caspase family protein [Rhodopseudomonas palustris]UYO54611.1 caspase family protein [Rhodopseudomonas palustris]